METRTRRRLSGVVGLLTLLGAGGLFALFGVRLAAAPATLLQFVLLASAGVVDLVAAVDSPVTERVAWYRLAGVGNVLLGLALPVGYAGSLGGGTAGGLILAASALGGLALAGMGVDMIAFDGRHMYAEPLRRGR